MLITCDYWSPVAAQALMELWKPMPARSKFTEPTKLPSTFMQACGNSNLTGDLEPMKLPIHQAYGRKYTQ